jgi:hypothetical protein
MRAGLVPHTPRPKTLLLLWLGALFGLILNEVISQLHSILPVTVC